jgi:hypothetical protein
VSIRADFIITWNDHGREPTGDPDPRFPHGMDADLSRGASRTCAADLPYPARRCGFYSILCRRCSYSAIVTTAGRADDPRSIKLRCKEH